MPDTVPVNTDDNTNLVDTPNPDDTTTTDRLIDKDIDPIPTAELADSELFPKTIESERSRDRAEELFHKGRRLYNGEKFDEAKEAYLEALKCDDTYSYPYNII